MKRILWISRHVMTKEQLEGLARLYGEFEVEIYAGTVESMGQQMTHRCPFRRHIRTDRSQQRSYRRTDITTQNQSGSYVE